MIEREPRIPREETVEELIKQLAHLKELKEQGINVCTPSKDITRKIRRRLGLNETPVS